MRSLLCSTDPPHPLESVLHLSDLPGISLQSLRWVLFPKQGVLLWEPHTRLLICKPESSQADHWDQVIQPPERREEINQYRPKKKWKAHQALTTCPSNLTRWPNNPNETKAVVVLTRLKEWTQTVCLVHSGDICLPSQAFMPFPRSSSPSSKQKLQPWRKEKVPAPLFEACTRCTRSACIQEHWSGSSAAMKGWWKTWTHSVCSQVWSFGTVTPSGGRGQTPFAFPISLVFSDWLLSLHHLFLSFCTKIWKKIHLK